MPSSARYFTDSGNELPHVDTRKELLASLERINAHNPPVQTCSTGWSFSGLYAGSTSIAYLFYRLHSIYPDMVFKGQSFLDWSQAYLDLSSNMPKRDPDPNHCGIANETLAYYALKSVMTKDSSFVDKLCSYQTIINSKSQSGSNEWLYGRAGYLYFLRLARSEFDAHQYSSASRRLAQSIQKTVERILEEPQPWIWHDTQYLGAAHGVIGIICEVVLAEPTTSSGLQYLLSYLLDQQYASGNFPSSLPAGSDKLVQFCHGGPGFVLSLEAILPYFPALTIKIQEAIAAARQDVRVRGLLTKAPSLCHGIAGNALAMENHEQMGKFAAHMTSEMLERRGWMQDAGRSDNFASLYTGEAGRAWVWAVLDQDLPRTCIGYNDL